MKRTKARSVINIVIVLVFTGLVGLVAQSCNSSKKCGCGHDLNRVYKHRRSHNW